MDWTLSKFWMFSFFVNLLAITACSDDESNEPNAADLKKSISFELVAELGSPTIAQNFAVSANGNFIFYTSNNQVYRHQISTGDKQLIVENAWPPPSGNSTYVHYLDNKVYVINVEDNKSYVQVSSDNGETFVKHHIGTKLGSLDFEGPFWRVLFNRFLKMPDGSLVIPYLGDNIAISIDDGATWSLKESEIGFITANQGNKLFGMESTWMDEFGRVFEGVKFVSSNVGNSWEIYDDILPTAVDRQNNLVSVGDDVLLKQVNGSWITYEWEQGIGGAESHPDYYRNDGSKLSDIEFDADNNLYYMNNDGSIYRTRLE